MIRTSWRSWQPSSAPIPVPVNHDSGRHPISPDGTAVAVSAPEGGTQLASLAGLPTRSFPGIVGEQPIAFSGDGTALFAMHDTGESIELERIDIASGTRTSWTRITPEQRPVYYSVAVDPTGERITYSTNSDSSDLYVIEQPAH